MKKKLTAFLLTVLMLVSLGSLNAAAYDADLASSVTSNYKSALSIAGRGSFHGHCNLATAYQLRAMGIYNYGLDYSGAGDSWYNYFQNVEKTSGGYNVITVGGSNCLYDLVKKYGNEIYNVVYCLGTGGTSGSTHVLYIRAIIDGYVYFADSFGTSYNKTYYPEGTCTVLSLSDFVSAYKRMNGNAYGCVYFAGATESEHLSGSTQNPEEWENQTTVYTTGTYTVTASLLRFRNGASTDDKSLGLIENGTTVTVTQIKDNWGKITWNGITGWICLDYTVQLTCDETTKNELISMMLESDKSVTFCGDTVTWTASVSGTTASKYFYAFYIYKDGEKVYSGTFSSHNTVTYVPDIDGTYKATVEIVDDENRTTVVMSSDVYCITDRSSIIYGDANGDGVVTAADARLVLRVSALMETLTGKNFVSADIDKNNKITASDARKILRVSSNLERDEES